MFGRSSFQLNNKVHVVDQISGMQIGLADLEDAAVIALLREHLVDMHEHSPAESIHALDLDELSSEDVTFWCLRADGALMGCGALKMLSSEQGEIKTMRTASAFRRRGVAAAILKHIVQESIRRGYDSLSLETGSMAAFEPARRLYQRHDFVECAPFADYVEDSNSVFMTKSLIAGSM